MSNLDLLGRKHGAGEDDRVLMTQRRRGTAKMWGGDVGRRCWAAGMEMKLRENPPLCENERKAEGKIFC